MVARPSPWADFFTKPRMKLRPDFNWRGGAVWALDRQEGRRDRVVGDADGLERHVQAQRSRGREVRVLDADLSAGGRRRLRLDVGVDAGQGHRGTWLEAKRHRAGPREES